MRDLPNLCGVWDKVWDNKALHFLCVPYSSPLALSTPRCNSQRGELSPPLRCRCRKSESCADTQPWEAEPLQSPGHVPSPLQWVLACYSPLPLRWPFLTAGLLLSVFPGPDWPSWKGTTPSSSNEHVQATAWNFSEFGIRPMVSFIFYNTSKEETKWLSLRLFSVCPH